MLIRVAFLLALAVLFLGTVGMQLLGRRLGVRGLARDPASLEGSAAVEGTLFALLGLLFAFTFSGAQDRLEVRRKLIVEEANTIGTAFSRLDLLPEAKQPRLREEFRRYADVRIDLYDKLLNFDAARRERERGAELATQIWKDGVAAARDGADARAVLLLVPALNQMIDLTTARDAALRTHVPGAIFVLLVLLSLVCGFFAGLGMSRSALPSRLHVLAFAGVLALTAYVVLNLEFPRVGFVQLGPIDALLAEVRAGMG